MKKIIILAIMAMLSLTTLAQRQPTWATYNLYSKVKHITSVTVYEGASDMNYQETYYFDNEGKQTSYTRKGFGKEQQITYPLEINADPLVRSNYDQDQDIVERLHFNPNNTLAHSTHYVYSAPHKLIMTIDYEYSEDGVIVVRTLTEYNDKHNPINVHKYTPDEVLLLEEHYTYDKYDNLVKKIQIFYDDIANTQTKIVEQRKYKYDRYSNWYSQQYILNGTKRYTITRTLDYYNPKK